MCYISYIFNGIMNYFNYISFHWLSQYNHWLLVALQNMDHNNINNNTRILFMLSIGRLLCVRFNMSLLSLIDQLKTESLICSNCGYWQCIWDNISYMHIYQYGCNTLTTTALTSPPITRGVLSFDEWTLNSVSRQSGINPFIHLILSRAMNTLIWS